MGLEKERVRKEHYISFVAAVSSDDIQMRTLYPEGSAETRFKIRGVRRRELEKAADMLFG